ncbi:conjugal transfer protein TraG N-terminal domain-containing protein [Duganella vulcania]|uniref:TraG N-terminal Proteobacteria domain-containing protein n=1 Tax=Duganella vulcania TaxID=2692166 RepID=A0A845GJ70_9BURK|nr:conjugal transfer protein TraG N-terminal domain-containing protein [Duganella vulcania]MYM92699.1 hypothetical protein [Duganella vulcania]
MTPFWIYSIGDATMLTNAFTGVAMVFNDHGNVSAMVGMGLMFSLLVLGGRAIVKQRFDLEYFFVGFVLYMLFFVPKVSVHVEDAYTASGQDIDNIPLGLAVPMSIVTRLGHYLTITYETAFSAPSMTTNGYLDSLNILAKMDGFSVGSAATGSGNSGESRNSLVSYIAQCALYDANNPSPEQEVSWAKIQTSTDIWGALRTTFFNRFITTYIPDIDPPEGTDRTCSDAYEALTLYLQGDFNSRWNDYLKYVFGKTSPAQSVSDAMVAVGVGSNSAQTFMMNALMRNLLNDGKSVYTASTGEVVLASMVTQAAEQRRYQWATEQTLFKEVARPLMAFIESFVVCLAPIMCFLVVIGPMGVDLAGKYFLSIVWISLWPPVMSIVNTYIYFAANKDVSSLLSSAGIDPTTYSGMESLYTTVGSWIGTGGLMAASVPVLTLTLVYGGAVTASALASRMQSGQHINSKLAAPDIASAAPVVSQQSAMTNSPNIGNFRSGLESGYVSYSFGQMADSAVSKRNSQIEAVSSNASTAYTSGFGFNKNDTETNARYAELANSIRSGTSATDQTITSVVDGFAQSHNFNAQQTNALMVAARANGGLGTGAAMPVAQGNIAATIASQTGLNSSDSMALAKQFTQQLTSQSGLQKSIAQDNSKTDGTRFSDQVSRVYGAELGRRVSETESAVSTASEAKEKVASVRSSFGASQNLPEYNLAKQLAEAGDHGESLVKAARAGGAVYEQKFNSELEKLERLAPKNPNNELMAAARVLSSTADGRAQLADMLSGVTAGGLSPSAVAKGALDVHEPDTSLLNNAGGLKEAGKGAVAAVDEKMHSAPPGIVGPANSPSAAPSPTVIHHGGSGSGSGKAMPSHNGGGAHRKGTLAPEFTAAEQSRLNEASHLKPVLPSADVTGEDSVSERGRAVETAMREHFHVDRNAQKTMTETMTNIPAVAKGGAKAVDAVEHGLVERAVDFAAPPGTSPKVKEVASDVVSAALAVTGGGAAGKALHAMGEAKEAAAAAKVVEKAEKQAEAAFRAERRAAAAARAQGAGKGAK